MKKNKLRMIGLPAGLLLCIMLFLESLTGEILHAVLGMLLAVLVLSGILIHPLHGMLAVKLVHKFAAVIFMIGVVVHMIQNKKRL